VKPERETERNDGDQPQSQQTSQPITQLQRRVCLTFQLERPLLDVPLPVRALLWLVGRRGGPVIRSRGFRDGPAVIGRRRLRRRVVRRRRSPHLLPGGPFFYDIGIVHVHCRTVVTTGYALYFSWGLCLLLYYCSKQDVCLHCTFAVALSFFMFLLFCAAYAVAKSRGFSRRHCTSRHRVERRKREPPPGKSEKHDSNWSQTSNDALPSPVTII